MRLDNSGRLWVGADRGLFEYDETSDRFRAYSHDPANPSTISAGTIGAICEDSLGKLWIGNAGGLNLLDRETGDFTHYTSKEGLIDNWVAGIFEERPGHLLVATAKGLSRFDYRSKTATNTATSA